MNRLFASLAAILLLSGPAFAQTGPGPLKIKGRPATIDTSAPAPPTSGSVTLRPNETQEVDLSGFLATVDDTNRVSIAVTDASGLMTANVWRYRSLGDGDTGSFVRLAMSDLFSVTAGSCTNGQSLGTIALSGYAGANGTGSLNTQNITVSCTTAKPTEWDFGARTLGRHGGVPMHTYGWPCTTTITSQTNSGQFAIYGADNATLASATQCRLALAASTYGSTTPTVAPTAGTDATVTLSTGDSIVMHFIANQADVAPFPLNDNAASTNLENQLSYAVRSRAGFYCSTFMLDDGTYAVDQPNGYPVGFTLGFGTTTITEPSGCTKPAGPFAGDSFDWSPKPTFHPSFTRVTSRNLWGATLTRAKFNISNIANRSTNPTVGWRFTRLNFAEFGFGDASNSTTNWDFLALDHNKITGTVSMASGLTRQGFVIESNWFDGPVAVSASGKDQTITMNRFDKEFLADPDDVIHGGWTCTSGKKALIAFNLFINKQGSDSADHEDYIQQVLQDSGIGGSAGAVCGPQIIGNVIWGGARRTATGTDPAQPGYSGLTIGGQGCIFAHDRPTFTYHRIWILGNIINDVCQFVQIDGGAVGSVASYNTIVRDYSYTDSHRGSATPNFYLGFPMSDQSGTGTVFTVKKNVMTSSSWATDGGFCTGSGSVPTCAGSTYVPPVSQSIDKGSPDSNTYSANQTWLTTNLRNPLAGSAMRDLADIVAPGTGALDWKNGVTPVGGALYDRSIIDLERGTYDFTALTN